MKRILQGSIGSTAHRMKGATGGTFLMALLLRLCFHGKGHRFSSWLGK